MTEDPDTTVAEISVRLLEDAYLAWFSAETDCEVALHTWLRGAGAGSKLTYSTYRAALDREEAAARDLERLWVLCEPYRQQYADSADSLCK
jgi:hypothetical protein